MRKLGIIASCGTDSTAMIVFPIMSTVDFLKMLLERLAKRLTLPAARAHGELVVLSPIVTQMMQRQLMPDS